MFGLMALVALGAEEAVKEKEKIIPDKELAEWWKLTAAQTNLSKQFSEAQTLMKTIPEQFVKNGEALKALEAKACGDKHDFMTNPQTGDPSCVAKPPAATQKKDDGKKESAKK